MADSADTFTYGYAYNQASATAPRIGSTTGTQQDFHPYTLTKSGTVTLQTIRSKEAKQDILREIENYAGTVKRSRYTYGVNLIAQRTDVTTAFDLGSSLTHNAGATTWKYDGLGQIVLADAPSTTADRAYEYDGIGNRSKAANSLTLPTPNNYVSNALNQYTTVDSFTPGYDSDGNQTTAQIKPLTGSLMSSNFVWDAENRKIEVKDNSTTTRVTYAYDALSRRIARTLPDGSVTQYLYDGWNCIAEYSGSSGTLTLTRTWGLDLSGGKQGAGGVGGLLSEIRGSDRYYPTYDGNISEYLNADGTTAAHFEYDAFGNTVVAANPSGILFTYRFSTKPIEQLTGLYYYGYRWYAPLTGRWPSRDPIEEQGGLNLYGFVGNDGVGSWDSLGLFPYPTEIRGNPQTPGILSDDINASLNDNCPIPLDKAEISSNFRLGKDTKSDLSLWLLIRMPNWINQEATKATKKINAVMDMVCKTYHDSPLILNIPYNNKFVPNAWAPPNAHREIGRGYPEITDNKPYRGQPRSPSANEHPADIPFSLQESFINIGRFDISVSPVTVIWRTDYNTDRRCYSWVADINFYNNFGLSTGDLGLSDQILKINLLTRFNDTQKIGSIEIEGSGCCCP